MEICRTNFNAIWPYLLVSMKNADFIALDLELSGLGSRLASAAKNVADRYAALRDAARTRGILSLGLAFFKKAGQKETKRRIKFQCQVFNILSLCAEPFTVEPEALEFLSKHSFDFNQLIDEGVRYYPSNISKACPLRSLMTELLSRGVPLILHNGLVDLAFLYHHFYSPIPDSFGEFCNALSDLFPLDSPVCDAKYLAEYQTRMTGSFLEYVFRKCLYIQLFFSIVHESVKSAQIGHPHFSQGDNVREALGARWHLTVAFDETDSMMKVLQKACEKVDCPLPDGFPDHVVPFDLKEKVCEQFSYHGFCRKQRQGQCQLIHDVDYAIDLENEKLERNRRKRKRRFDHLKPDSVLEKERLEEEEKTARRIRVSVDEMRNKPRIAVTGCHRAGVDAFMTGFAALFQSRLSLCRDGKLDEQSLNRIPLSGKANPFIIQPTQFSGNCSKHENRFAAIKSARLKNTCVSTASSTEP
ncbi:CAF1 family ribonuclease [Ancylostoma caninum]|uniref:CAF1 family ribonuclease n=1 Tax=Ancylostoma caninum TaxID=29170 RepID=A0A368H855_ANCCA|nr:CAF1 family ribonuclease [Ancylostoma caninum]